MYAPLCSGHQGIDLTRIVCYKTKLEEEHPRYCQAKGSKVKEKLVHLMMMVKFKVLIEKNKMYSLGLMRLIGDGVLVWAFGGVGDEEIVVREGLEEEALVKFMVEWFEEDEDGKKNGKEGLFNLKS
ncbi:hypothetical protein Tco_0994197 [Tanacetum coccineum]